MGCFVLLHSQFPNLTAPWSSVMLSNVIRTIFLKFTSVDNLYILRGLVVVKSVP